MQHFLYPFNRAFISISLIALVGPALTIATTLAGGDPMDGFAGGTRHNTDLHGILFMISIYATLFLALINTGIAIYAGSKFHKTSKAYYALPVYALLSPLIFLFITAVLSADIANQRNMDRLFSR